MILHLMKYEIKSTYRIFLTIVVSFILLTVLLCIGMTNQNTILLMLFSLSAFVIGCATFVTYFVTILNRYYKNLYGREGYLMLTLPVKGWQLVCSKFIIAMFWSVILGVTICFCIIATLQVGVWMAPPNYPYTLWELLKDFTNVIGDSTLIYFLIAVLVGVAETIARIYFVISVAYLPIIRKWNIVVALVLYFAIDTIEIFFIRKMTNVLMTNTNVDFVDLIVRGNLVIGYGVVVISIIITAILLLCSSYIISKKTSIR